MIIVDNTQYMQSFSDISIGRVFKKEYEGEAKPDYCMKIYPVLDLSAEEQYNAVNLEDGSLWFFEGHEQVIPYEATLHLDL